MPYTKDAVLTRLIAKKLVRSLLTEEGLSFDKFIGEFIDYQFKIVGSVLYAANRTSRD